MDVTLPKGRYCLFASMVVAALAVSGCPEKAPYHPAISDAHCRQEAKLTAHDATWDDFFGGAVSVSGDVAVVGARGDDDAGESSGSAYVFRYDGTNWNREAKLTADDAKWDDFFGNAVSVSGDVIVIGARQDNDAGHRSGSAYVFRYDGMAWNQEAKLTAHDAAEKDFFGGSVSVSGDVVVVGAHGDDDEGESTGAAYVFRFDGTHWHQETKLLADDGEWDDFFGGAVSVHGDVTVVGAAGDEHAGVDSGSAYVFRYDGMAWSQEAKLVSNDAADWDFFGRSLSVFGDVAIVGARGDDDAGESTGAAYAFRYDGMTWSQEAKLKANDATWDDFFGVSVSVSGNMAVIGARGNSDDGHASGSAYLFRHDGMTWKQKCKLTAHDAAARDFFGSAVSLSQGVAVIGAPGDDDAGESTGAAYVFRKTANTPPVADAGGPYVVECRDAADGSTSVMLDGSASTDPDGYPLTYLWSTDQAGASFDDATLAKPTLTMVGAPLDTPFDVTLTVDDGKDWAKDTTTVTVRDTTPPELTLSPSPDRLWPPNHKMVDVDVTVSVTDLCDSNPVITLVSVVNSEPDNGTGDGNTTDDIQGVDLGTDDSEFALRAERSGPGVGRVYTITYRATDASGNTTEESTTVTVPHHGPNHKCDFPTCDLNK